VCLGLLLLTMLLSWLLFHGLRKGIFCDAFQVPTLPVMSGTLLVLTLYLSFVPCFACVRSATVPSRGCSGTTR
jgi:hypothetical protein